LKNFGKAIDAANASNKIMPPPAHPIALAILAMSHCQLNHETEQIEFREAFDKAMQSEAFKNDPDCQKFASEVEEIFGANVADKESD